jgi:type I restriction enzyme M protein
VYEQLGQTHSGLGQFFTPPNLCDLCASLTVSGMEKKEEPTIMDPCCGSGRMPLAATAHVDNGIYSLVDLDPICVRMSAINMALHGMKGEVNCMNALGVGDDWRFGYIMMPNFIMPGIRLLHYAKFEQTNIYHTYAGYKEMIKANQEQELLKRNKGSLFDGLKTEILETKKKPPKSQTTRKRSDKKTNKGDNKPPPQLSLF